MAAPRWAALGLLLPALAGTVHTGTPGAGTTLDLAAGKTSRPGRVRTPTSATCTTTPHTDEQGTWAAERAELVLRRQHGEPSDRLEQSR